MNIKKNMRPILNIILSYVFNTQKHSTIIFENRLRYFFGVREYLHDDFKKNTKQKKYSPVSAVLSTLQRTLINLFIYILGVQN